jgi:hypothetical protein
MEFKNVLWGQYKTAWKPILHKNFPELDDLSMVPAKQKCSCTKNFHCALELFIKKALHKEKPRDHQYIYMMPAAITMSQKNL